MFPAKLCYRCSRLHRPFEMRWRIVVVGDQMVKELLTYDEDRPRKRDERCHIAHLATDDDLPQPQDRLLN